MAGFGSLAPGMDTENDLLSQPQYTYGLPPLQKPDETPPQQGLPPPGWISKAYQEAAPDDWRAREALEGMAGELEANRPSGFRTMWNAIRHPSLAPIIQQVREAQKAQQPPTQEELAKLPDVGQPLISPGPQISGGTTIGRAIQGPLYEATREALRTGFTDPHEALYGNIPMWDPLTGHTSERMVQAGQNVAALAGGAEGVAGTTEHALNAPGRDVRLLGRQILRSDTAAPGAAISIAEHAPQYTTGIEGALSRIPSNELTAAQWANQLKRFGAKPEEMEWRQLGPALEGLGNAKISKAGIEEHLANNPVELKPIEKTAPVWEYLNSEQQHWVYDQWRDRGGPANSGYDTPKDYYEALGGSSGLPKSIFHGNPEYPDYTLPGGTNYRERLMTLPGEEPSADFTKAHGSHWDEPNVLFHRRSTDREFEQPLPPEHEAQNQQRMAMLERADNLRQQQGQVGMEITKIARPYDQARNKRIYEDMRAGRITPGEAERQMSSYYEPPPEIKPLQDKLQALRANEDELRRTAPEQIQPQTVQSLHDEENQSDWHQQGRDKGYGPPPELTPDELEELKGLSYRRMNEGRREGIEPLSEEELTRYGELQTKYENNLQKDRAIPNAPFKGTAWERLALHDQLREAAEKGYPRISWTAGEENPTNPLTMLRNEGRRLETLPAERQAQLLRADRGIRDYYNRRRVDQANKIGKAHDVQVQKSHLQTPGQFKNDRLERYATYHMDIPDSLRKELLTKPMSLFEDSGEAGK